MLLSGVGVAAQTLQDAGEAILAFCGAADMTEVDQEEFERLSEYFERPLKINKASQARLLESGLFDSYQAASLADYRLVFAYFYPR